MPATHPDIGESSSAPNSAGPLKQKEHLSTLRCRRGHRRTPRYYEQPPSPTVPHQFPISSTFSASAKMPQYTSREVGDPSQIKKTKQSMADLKLRRLTELNSRLREDLDRERIPVSQASKR